MPVGYYYGSRLSEDGERELKELIRNSDMKLTAYDMPYCMPYEYAEPMTLLNIDGDNTLSAVISSYNKIYICYSKCHETDGSDFKLSENRPTGLNIYEEFYHCDDCSYAVFESSDPDFYSKAQKIYNRIYEQ